MYLEWDLYRISNDAERQGAGQGGRQMRSALILSEDQKLPTKGRCWELRKGFPGRAKHVQRNRGIKQHQNPPPGSPTGPMAGGWSIHFPCSVPSWPFIGDWIPSLFYVLLLRCLWRGPHRVAGGRLWDIRPNIHCPSWAMQPTVNLVEQTPLFAEDWEQTHETFQQFFKQCKICIYIHVLK